MRPVWQGCRGAGVQAGSLRRTGRHECSLSGRGAPKGEHEAARERGRVGFEVI